MWKLQVLDRFPTENQGGFPHPNVFKKGSEWCLTPTRSGDGFVGNRMLAPYAGEAKMVAEEGATVEQIDKVGQS